MHERKIELMRRKLERNEERLRSLEADEQVENIGSNKDAPNGQIKYAEKRHAADNRPDRGHVHRFLYDRRCISR